MQVQMTITYDTDTKNVMVNGPTSDVGLCHLILNLAEQSLYSFTEQQISQRRIVTPFPEKSPALPPNGH